MSKVLVEHPVLFIERLLKLGVGDKGRLLYLRNAMTRGTKIHDSDKKFLKKMQQELEKTNGSNRKENYIDEKDKNLTGSKSEILKIQNQLSDLKHRDSKLMDNLELLVISHEGFSSPKIENSNSFVLFPKLLKSKNTEWFSSVKKNLKFKKF